MPSVRNNLMILPRVDAWYSCVFLTAARRIKFAMEDIIAIKEPVIHVFCKTDR